MTDIKIIVPLGELDISKEAGFGVSYSVDEIQDISKRNSAYSKTITLPGNKNNNFLLGELFDINTDFTYFNPNIKTDATIIVNNSSVIIKGYLQLKQIIKNNVSDLQGNRISYEVVVFDEVVDIFKEMGDKVLNELDFTDYNHTYTKDNIVASWAHTADDVYGYPNMYNGTKDYLTRDFKPGIFHKAYLQKIAEANNFSLGGTFMNDADYATEIVPFGGEIVPLPAAEIARRLFRAGMSNSTETFLDTVLLGGLANNNGATLSLPTQPFTYFTDDTTLPNFDPNGHWDTTTNVYTADKNGTYNIDGKLLFDITYSTTRSDIIAITQAGPTSIQIQFAGDHNFEPYSNVTVEISGTTNFDGSFPSGHFYYNPTLMGTDTIQINSAFTGTYPGNESSGTFSWDAYQQTYNLQTVNSTQYEVNPALNQLWKYDITVKMWKNSTSNLAAFTTYPLYVPVGTGTNPAFSSANSYTVNNSTISTSLARTSIFLHAGDQLDFDLTVNSSNFTGNGQTYLKYAASNSVQTNGDAVPVIVTFKLKQTDGTDYSTVYNTINSTLITDGDEIILGDYVSNKFKQKDIFTDIVKRYNLYISIDPDNNRRLLLNTRDEYYANGDILDWTDKKDYTYDDKIALLSDLQNKEMLFTYKADKDDWNENYTKSVSGDIYGQQRIIFDNEFIKDTKKVETPFSPTPSIYNSANKTMVVPGIGTVNPKTNLRTLYYSQKNTLNSKTWNFYWIDPTLGIQLTKFNYYGYAGHYNDPISPTLDLNFGEVPYEWYNELTTTTNQNLYNRFWRAYIEQIAEGKIVTSRFHLTEVDIANLRNNLNAKVFVKDSYYYINKIQDYDPTGSGLTVVELLKMNTGLAYPQERSTHTAIYSTPEVITMATVGGIGGGVSDGGSATGYANLNSSNSSRTSLSGQDNYIGYNSDRTMIIGNNNIISDNVTDVGILGGSNNFIYPGVTGSWIIGASNKVITKDNEIWIDTLHIVDGQVQSSSSYNLIDGGLDRNANPFSANLIQLIDGGEDTVRAVNGTNPENLIDGGEDTV